MQEWLEHNCSLFATLLSFSRCTVNHNREKYPVASVAMELSELFSNPDDLILAHQLNTVFDNVLRQHKVDIIGNTLGGLLNRDDAPLEEGKVHVRHKRSPTKSKGAVTQELFQVIISE